MNTQENKNEEPQDDGSELPSLTVANFRPDDGWLEHIAKLLILARSNNSFASGEHRLNQKNVH